MLILVSIRFYCKYLNGHIFRETYINIFKYKELIDRSYIAIFILFLKERGDRGKPFSYLIKMFYDVLKIKCLKFAQRATVSYNKLKYVTNPF